MSKGRPSILEERGLTVARIVQKFEELGTALKVATELGIDEKTVRKYLRLGGVRLRTGPPKGTKYKRNKKAQLDEWVMENPNVVLPRDPKEITALTGLSKDAIASKLRRRKLDFIERMEKLPDLRQTRLIVKKKDQKYPAKKWASYNLKGDPLNGIVTIHATVGRKEILFRVPLHRIETILAKSETNQS
jgi:hypothetical protein